MKHALLIMTDFYGYNIDFIKSIEKNGYVVHWICNRPKLNYYTRIRKKIDKSYFFKLNNSMLKRKLDELKNIDISKIIVVYAGDYMNRDNIQLLKNQFPRAELIYYDWDSVKFYPNVIDFLDLFDRKYSFDNNDSIDFRDKGLMFRPLFYVNDCVSLTGDKIYDVSTFMTFDILKAEQLYRIKKMLPDCLRKYLFIRMRFKSTYFTYKIKYSYVMKNFRLKDFSFDSLSRNEIFDLIKGSSVVIDIPLKGQNGLTMRTFETLALKRKIITTNTNVKKYDFYSPDNIFVVDEHTERIPLDFFTSPFNYKYNVSSYYSLEEFAKEILGI